MIAADLAPKLLEDVIYERVIRHIDVAGLHRFELELWLSLREHASEEMSFGTARAMIDRALDRFRTDPRRIESDSPFGDCELCAEEAAEAVSESERRRPAGRANGTRAREHGS